MFLHIFYFLISSFNENTKELLSKTSRITGALKNTLSKTKINSWHTNTKLYSSVIIPSLLFGAEIWGSVQCNKIEKGLVQYFKWVQSLQKTTPNYIIRREIGELNLETVIITKILN